MISDVLNRYPDVISLSVFFPRGTTVIRPVPSDRQLNVASPPRAVPTFEYSFPRRPLRIAVPDQRSPGSLLFEISSPDPLRPASPFDRAARRPFQGTKPVVRSRPNQTPSDLVRDLFHRLSERFDSKVWIDRSGGSLITASQLMSHFPEARIVPIYRDGRDTTLSLSKHPALRVSVAMTKVLNRREIDYFKVMNQTGKLKPSDESFRRSGFLTVNLKKLPLTEFEYSVFVEFWSVLIKTGHCLFRICPSTACSSCDTKFAGNIPSGKSSG